MNGYIRFGGLSALESVYLPKLMGLAGSAGEYSAPGAGTQSTGFAVLILDSIN
jgi:hypothetical protein